MGIFVKDVKHHTLLVSASRVLDAKLVLMYANFDTLERKLVIFFCYSSSDACLAVPFVSWRYIHLES